MPLEEGETRFAFDVFPQQAANLNLQLQKNLPAVRQCHFHQIQVPVFYGMAQKVPHFQIMNLISNHNKAN